MTDIPSCLSAVEMEAGGSLLTLPVMGESDECQFESKPSTNMAVYAHLCFPGQESGDCLVCSALLSLPLPPAHTHHVHCIPAWGRGVN